MNLEIRVKYLLLAFIPIVASLQSCKRSSTEPQPNEGEVINWEALPFKMLFATSSPVSDVNHIYWESSQLSLLDPVSRSNTKLFQIDSLSVVDFCLSPDASKIAFASIGKHRVDLRQPYTIYVMNIDGTDLHSVRGPFRGIVSSLSWSVDGRLAYLFRQTDSANYNTNEIWIDGTRFLSDMNGSLITYDNPAWTQDGTSLVFAITSGGRNGIYKVRVSDKSFTLLFSDTTSALPAKARDVQGQIVFTNLAISPDGRKIFAGVLYFTNYPNTIAKSLWTLNSDGTDPIAIFSEEVSYDNYYPNFRPFSVSWDGQKIAFLRSKNYDDNYYYVYVMNVDGTNIASAIPYAHYSYLGVKYLWLP